MNVRRRLTGIHTAREGASRGAVPILGSGNTTYMLCKRLLRQLVELALHVIVVAFTHSSNLCETWLSDTIPDRGKRGERVLRLTNRHHVADDAQEIAASHRVDGVTTKRKYGAEKPFRSFTARLADLITVTLERLLMLTHLREMPGAQFAIPLILSLLRVFFEVLQQRAMLHDGVADLSL